MCRMEDLWQLIKAGDFARAVAGYSRLLEQPTSRSRFVFSNRARAYLNLGDHARAQRDYQSAEELCHFPSGYYRSWVGVCEWLRGREAVGAQIWLDIVQSIEEGKITYTDGAGGVGDGCLLWFASVKLGDADLQRAACGFLQAKIGTKGGRNWKIGNWPGPIAGLLLGRSTPETLLDAVTQTPIRREREHCQACFYIAARHLSEHDTSRQRELLSSATQTFVPHEQEFYLAQHELDRAKD